MALAASGALPEVLADGYQLNYAVKSREGRHVAVPNFRDAGTASLPVLESVPDVDAKLKAPVTADRKFEDVVKSAQDAAVLVLVYWCSSRREEAHYSSRRCLSLLTSAATVESGGADPRLLNK
jgi:hypothetical protein